ncbi:MAG: formate dehydrogenase subunit gamma [Smithellaceae bacterium]
MMMQTIPKKIRILIWLAIFASLTVGLIYLQAAGVMNPRGNFWRVVREGIAAYSSTPQQGHTILIVNGGENWREIRNSFVMPLSQWILIGVLVAIGLMYKIIGPEKLEKVRSGIKVERYRLPDRVLHWYTAGLFILMALTGLSLLLGRIFLIPVFGLGADSTYLQFCKVVHNYCGPLLLIGIVLEVVRWVKFNIPEKVDLEWIKKVTGGLHGAKPHIGRVNAGQKAWFWLVAVFGIIVGITGVLLDFPIWGQSRATMQLSHIIHAVTAILFIGAALGHIYMGSIGVEGVFEGMWHGTVDAVWAEQHADIWYEEKIRENAEKPDAEAS